MPLAVSPWHRHFRRMFREVTRRRMQLQKLRPLEGDGVTVTPLRGGVRSRPVTATLTLAKSSTGSDMLAHCNGPVILDQ